MGKTVLADDSLWNYCKQFNPSKGYVTGLIIGQSSSSGDFVSHLARISVPENYSKQLKDNKTEGSSLSDIPESWVTTQACDVTRMLPGGMWVLGIFFIGQSDPFENHQNCSRIRTILRHMRTELKKKLYWHGDSPTSEKLALHLNVEKNLISCRAVDVDGSAIRPIDLKFQKNDLSWVQIDCRPDFYHVKHLSKSDSSKQIRNQLQGMVEAVNKSVSRSAVSIGNESISCDDLIEKLLSKPKGAKKNKGSDKREIKSLYADLYERMIDETDIKSSSGVDLSEDHGIMYFVGGPICRVFVNPKLTYHETCEAVRQDIIRSIAVRVDMHADSLVEEDPGESLETFHEPPQRVMIKLPSSNVTFSDYLFPGEGPEEALVSSKELLDLELEAQDVQTDLEKSAVEDQEWESKSNMEVQELDLPTQRNSTFYVMVALIALFVALSGILIQMHFNNQETRES